MEISCLVLAAWLTLVQSCTNPATPTCGVGAGNTWCGAGTTALNVSGFGTKYIYKSDGTKVAERDLDGVYDLVGYDFGKSPYYKQQVATGTDASYIRFGGYFWAVTTGPPSGPGLFFIGMYDYFMYAGASNCASNCVKQR